MICLLPPREIRTSFFTFNSLLCALTAAIAVMLSKAVLQSAWMDVRFLGLTVIGAQRPTARSDWRKKGAVVSIHGRQGCVAPRASDQMQNRPDHTSNKSLPNSVSPIGTRRRPLWRR